MSSVAVLDQPPQRELAIAGAERQRIARDVIVYSFATISADGLPVQVTVSGSPRPLPAAVDRAVEETWATRK